MGQGFADNHCTRLAQTLHTHGITTRPEAFEMRRAIGADVVQRVDVVFDRHGYTVQRPQVLALGQQVIGLARLGQCNRCIHLNEGVQGRVQPLDTVESGLGQFNAGQAAVAQAFSQLDDRSTEKIASMGR